jgi:hypothetical protein
MPITHNGTNITAVNFNGTIINVVVFNGTTVFSVAQSFAWVRIDGTDSQGGFAATYDINSNGVYYGDDEQMIAKCQFEYPANFYQGATINFYNDGYGYYTLFQSIAQ